MNVLLFEDRLVARLFPITVGRPAYAISCATWRLVDWLATLETPIRSVVRRHLAELERLDFPALAGAPHRPNEPTLLLNARLVPSRANRDVLARLLQSPRPGVVRKEMSVAAAVLPAGSPPPPAELGTEHFDDYLQYAGVGSLPPLDAPLALFDYPHDVLRHHLALCGEGLERRLAGGGYREIAEGVFAAEGATLGQYCVSDTKKGPILLDRGATVGPYSFLRGPAWLGPNCKVLEHSAIKDFVALGHTTKIGGEVEASIVEPYTNKQHHGFLGHSYLGSWINLGAGTCNSDLKNTYGEVKMDYAGERVATGMQFVGCIAGDYSKSAINTGIFTGKTIGACSMLYGFVTTNVPSFTNYARLFGQVTELSPDVMVATQQRMFLRRNVQQRPADAQLIHDMYALTRHERQLAGEPLHL